MNPKANYALTQAEHEHWNEAGFIGPFTAWSPDEIDARLPQIQTAYARPSAIYGFQTIRDRHLDSQVIWNIGTHPAIVDRCVALLGPDLLIWRSKLLCKRPGGFEIPPHQDLDFPGVVKLVPAIVPAVNITAWVALTDCTIERGCVHFFPGTHRNHYEVRPGPNRKLLYGGISPGELEGIEPVYMQVKRGQFFLFQQDVVHGSGINHSKSDRTGIGYRFTPTSTKVYDNSPLDCRGMPLKKWHTVLVSGENRYSHNRIGKAPDREDYPTGPVRNFISKFRKRYYKHVHGMQG